MKLEGGVFKGTTKDCYSCKGTKHTAADCMFKQEKCHAYGKVGHIAGVCCNKNTQNQGSKVLVDVKREKRRSSYYCSHKMQEKQGESSSDRSGEGGLTLNCIRCRLGCMTEVHLRGADIYIVEIKLNGKGVNFEIDTGCSLPVMNEHMERHRKFLCESRQNPVGDLYR